MRPSSAASSAAGLAWFGTTPSARSRRCGRSAERYRFDLDRTPWKALSDEAQHAVLYGDAFWRGLNAWAANDVGGKDSTVFPCRECGGRRLPSAVPGDPPRRPRAG